MSFLILWVQCACECRSGQVIIFLGGIQVQLPDERIGSVSPVFGSCQRISSDGNDAALLYLNHE